MRGTPILLALLLLAGLGGVAVGHVPELGGGDVTVVEDPTVSRVFYRSLDAGGTHRYRLRDGGADAIHVGLMTPQPRGKPPTARVTGRGLDATLEGTAEKPAFEPFAPDVLYKVDAFDATLPEGDGAVTVEVSGEGPYALVVGRAERFTATEWVGTGIAVPRTRLWADRWWLLLPGGAAAAGAGVWLRRRGVAGRRRWLAGLGGALALGSAAHTAAALGWAATVVSPGIAATVAGGVAALQVAVGGGLLRLATAESPDSRWRLASAGLGIAAAAVWAGAVVGPVLAVLAALPGLGELLGSVE